MFLPCITRSVTNESDNLPLGYSDLGIGWISGGGGLVGGNEYKGGGGRLADLSVVSAVFSSTVPDSMSTFFGGVFGKKQFNF